MDAVVYLVPLGRNRYELYSEPVDEGGSADGERGWLDRWRRRLSERWRAAVVNARVDEPADDPATAQRPGFLAKARDWLVCQVAETIASQRTLWSLRQASAVELRFPSDLSEPDATRLRRGLLAGARRHHGVWLVLDALLFAASGLLMLVPGPNLLAYYFGLRLVGHFLSWRGAARGDQLEWRVRAEPALAELGTLAGEPRDARAPRVEEIATTLNLPRLAAFFDRVAV